MVTCAWAAMGDKKSADSAQAEQSLFFIGRPGTDYPFPTLSKTERVPWRPGTAARAHQARGRGESVEDTHAAWPCGELTPRLWFRTRVPTGILTCRLPRSEGANFLWVLPRSGIGPLTRTRDADARAAGAQPLQCPPNTRVLNGSISAWMRKSSAWTSARASTACSAMPRIVPVSGATISSWLLEYALAMQLLPGVTPSRPPL